MNFISKANQWFSYVALALVACAPVACAGSGGADAADTAAADTADADKDNGKDKGTGKDAAEPALATAKSAEGLAMAKRVFASSNPKEAYDQMTEAERRTFDAVMIPVETVVTADDAVPIRASDLGRSDLSASSCWYIHITGSSRAAAGNTLYTFWQNTAICSNGSSVTSVWVDNADGETSTPGWRIDAPPDRDVRNVRWEGRGRAKYHFVLGAGGIDIQHPTNCLQGRLNADNVHYATSYSCDLG